MAVVLPSANGSILEEIEFEGSVGGKTKVEVFCKKNTTNTEKEEEQKPRFFLDILTFRLQPSVFGSGNMKKTTYIYIYTVYVHAIMWKL